MQGSNIDLLYEEFKDYGKEFIRSHKLHPDTYIQMVLQLAYYRLYHKYVWMITWDTCVHIISDGDINRRLKSMLSYALQLVVY